jgi:hypothetical protein
MLSAPRADARPHTHRSYRVNPFEMVAMLGTLGILSATVIRLVSIWTGRKKDALPPAALDRLEERLGRIEQAIDAVSIEVERISEGQRFTTKLLAERQGERVIPSR